MHNKSFTVDNLAPVVGSRDVARRNFEARRDRPRRSRRARRSAGSCARCRRSSTGTGTARRRTPRRLLLGDVVRERAPALARRVGSRGARGRCRLCRRARAHQAGGGLLAGDAPARVERRPCHPRRPGEASPRPPRSTCSCCPSSRPPSARPRSDARSGLAVLRARRTWGRDPRRPVRHGVRVRVADQLAGRDRRDPVHAGYAKRRARPARRGVRLLDLKPEPSDGSGGGPSGVGQQRQGRSACEDVLGRRPRDLRRLLQSRPSLVDV